MDKLTAKRSWLRLLRDRRGAATLMLGLAFFGLLGIAAIAIELTRLTAVRSDLQTAVDAAALAGVIELARGGGDASRDVAIDYAGRNTSEYDPVLVLPADVTFGIWDPDAWTFTPLPSAAGANAVDVVARKQVFNYVAWALNIPTSNAAARATAWGSAPVGETSCVKPWALPEELIDLDNSGEVEEWEATQAVGQQFTLKSAIGGPGDELGESGFPSFFYPVVLPPFWDYSAGGYLPDPPRGAAVYRENIQTCIPDYVGVGDSLWVEPGNMPGPTVQGARALCGVVMGTYCNPPYGMPMIAAFWDSDIDPIGRVAVRVAVLASFNLMEVYSQGQHGVIVGEFVELMDGGGIGYEATTLIRPILVR